MSVESCIVVSFLCGVYGQEFLCCGFVGGGVVRAFSVSHSSILHRLGLNVSGGFI